MHTCVYGLLYHREEGARVDIDQSTMDTFDRGISVLRLPRRALIFTAEMAIDGFCSKLIAHQTPFSLIRIRANTIVNNISDSFLDIFCFGCI